MGTTRTQQELARSVLALFERTGFVHFSFNPGRLQFSGDDHQMLEVPAESDNVSAAVREVLGIDARNRLSRAGEFVLDGKDLGVLSTENPAKRMSKIRQLVAAEILSGPVYINYVEFPAAVGIVVEDFAAVLPTPSRIYFVNNAQIAEFVLKEVFRRWPHPQARLASHTQDGAFDVLKVEYQQGEESSRGASTADKARLRNQAMWARQFSQMSDAELAEHVAMARAEPKGTAARAALAEHERRRGLDAAEAVRGRGESTEKLTIQQGIRQAMMSPLATATVVLSTEGGRLTASMVNPRAFSVLTSRTSTRIFAELMGNLVPGRGGSFNRRLYDAGYRTEAGRQVGRAQSIRIYRPSGPLAEAPATRRAARTTRSVARTPAAASTTATTAASRSGISEAALRRAGVAPLRLGSHGGESFSALMISPRLRQLVYIKRYGQEAIQLYYPGSNIREGEGYLDHNESYIFEGEKYRRSHTPAGVRDDAAKIGPLLYYGQCLLAVSEFDCVGIGSGTRAAGLIGRSELAEQFWVGQVRRGHAIDVTQAKTPGYTRERVINVPVLDRDLCDLVNDSECDTVTAATSQMKIAYKTKGRQIPLVQLLNVSSVIDQNIILNWTGQAPVEIPKLPADIICGLNLKDCKDVNLIIALAKYCYDERIAPEYVQNMLSTISQDVAGTVFSRLGYTPNTKFRPNAEVQREVDAVWKDFYGDLVKEF